MPITVTSPVPYYSGTVTLHSPLTFPQYFVWKAASEAAQEFTQPSEEPGKLDVLNVERYSAAFLNGVLPLIESHTIANMPATLTPDNFPASPMPASLTFIRWLAEEVSNLVWKENAVPKG